MVIAWRHKPTEECSQHKPVKVVEAINKLPLIDMDDGGEVGK